MRRRHRCAGLSPCGPRGRRRGRSPTISTVPAVSSRRIKSSVQPRRWSAGSISFARVSASPWGTLLAGGGERADLVVGAVAAGAPRWRRLKAAGADAGGGGLDGGDRFLGVVVRRRVAPDDVRVDEAQLHPLGQAPGHLAPGQRVQLELEVPGHPAVGVLLAGDLARLVIHDPRAEHVLLPPIVSAAKPDPPQRQTELLLPPGRLDAVPLLLVPSAP